MVVQKNWNNIEASPQNPVTEGPSSTWGFQTPAKATIVRSNTPSNMQAVSVFQLINNLSDHESD